MVARLIEQFQVKHLLDYGCGSRLSLYKNLKSSHKLTYQAYDPGVPQFSTDPVPAEMVCCIDVLEHIEPEYVDNVLDHLKALTEGLLFCTVCTVPALKTLPDGRNAHVTLQPISWWMAKLFDRFDVQSMTKLNNDDGNDLGFMVIAYAKSQIELVDGSKA
jgi:hypothetical protein